MFVAYTTLSKDTWPERFMKMTMSHKVLAKHAGLDQVLPGDIVTCQVDWSVVHDMIF